MDLDLPDWDDEEDAFEMDAEAALTGTLRGWVAKFRAEGYTDLQIASALVGVGNEILWDCVDEEMFGGGGAAEDADPDRT